MGIWDITFFRVVKAFRIFTGKGMLNDYWILCVFGVVNVFGK